MSVVSVATHDKKEGRVNGSAAAQAGESGEECGEAGALGVDGREEHDGAIGGDAQQVSGLGAKLQTLIGVGWIEAAGVAEGADLAS